MLRISKDADVTRTSLIRFVREQTSLHLDVADKLAAYFGLKPVAEKTSTRKAK